VTGDPDAGTLDDRTIDRRTLLRWFGVGAGAAVLAGCSSGTSRGGGPTTGAPFPTSRPATSSSTLPGGPPPWGQLEHQLRGRLVLPGASTYLTDLRLYDPRFDGVRPAAIAFCANPSDVQHSIAFARAHGLPFTARAGGHSYAGYSTTSGLVVDVTTMNRVVAAGGAATIGAGARLIDVYSSLNAQGVSIPGGSCATVGIAGLALGGGIGVVGRKHGLTCDAVSEVSVVTADSRLVRASATENDDLFWACRGGGGGNFGVVTSFAFDTFPVGDVALYTLRFPWAAAGQVLPAWMRWIDGAPDELWSNCIIATAGSGTPSISIGGIWTGPQSGVAPLIAHLVTQTGATPTTNFLETIPLAHAMYVEAGCAQLSQDACHLASQNPQGRLPRGPSVAASSFLDRPLSDSGVAAVTTGIEQRRAESKSGAIAFDSYGGAINRVPAAATAFVHRNSLCCAQYSVSFATGESAAAVAEHRAWLEQYGRALRPFVSDAAYQNYIDPTLTDWSHAYYGTNLARLQRVKQRWDPDDAFRFAQSIPLA
jgi:FAD/FMN-containing dehydrogenase